MLRARIIAMGKNAVFEQCTIKGGLYSLHTSREEIETFQAHRFNEVWQDAYENVPLYTRFKSEHGLPDRIESVAELVQWPILSRAEVRDADELLVRKGCPPDTTSMTGGSTGEPMRFGMYDEQLVMRVANTWVGRSRYGILPGSKQFVVWGHSHLLGTGLGRLTKGFARKIRDYIMGYCRRDAYDLSPKQLRKYYDSFARFRPDVFLGYSAAALAFCRANMDRRADCHKLGVRCVICSAGPLSDEGRQEVSEFFNAPVCMEYGSIECGAIAYTRPDTGHYVTFWDDFLLQASPSDDGPPRVIVNALARSYLPLIRYDLGDLVETDDDQVQSILGFRSIVGRPDDTITVGDASFHTLFMTHIIMKCSKVLAGQVVAGADTLTFRVVVSEELSDKDKDGIRQRAISRVPELANCTIEVEQVPELIKSPSGKVRLVICEDD